MKLDCAIRVRNRNQPAIRICRSTDDQRVFLLESYCRASHTGDAGRGRGRERERGMSSELANMTC